MVDFPGVDDRDETIPDLAELLLFLAQVVIFVVDYRLHWLLSTSQHYKSFGKVTYSWALFTLFNKYLLQTSPH